MEECLNIVLINPVLIQGLGFFINDFYEPIWIDLSLLHGNL